MNRQKDLPTKKISVFVDGANMFYSQLDTKFLINWDAFLNKFVVSFGILHEAFFYTGEHVPPLARTEKFLKLLNHLDFIIRKKKIKKIRDGASGEIKLKANLDIEIVIDMFNTIDQYDIAILCSGDGDFERAIELLRSRGKQVVVVSEKTSIARELKNAAGRYYYDFTTIEYLKLREWKEKKT